MGSNDRVVLETIFSERKDNVAPDLSPSKYFEIFTAEQILKDYDLSYDEIESGNVGNGGDGGFDAIFVFINDELLREDTNLEELHGSLKLDIHIIQSKKANGFSEDVIDKFILTTEEVFDLEKDLNLMRTRYNSIFIDKISTFKAAFLKLITKIKSISFSFYYATIGDTEEIHDNVKSKEKRLQDSIKKQFSNSSYNFIFLGSREIIELTRSEPSQTFEIKLSENPISTGSEGFVGLVRIQDYFSFLTDNNSKLRKNIFEANVRDFQGDVKVNQEILSTLESHPKEDFWWLNNGITIICTKASLSGKRIVLDNAQVVNGLQTSSVIYNYFINSKPDIDDRNILIRILATENEETRDKIIKATNSQTKIPDASLRATDPIHRDIEDYLCSKSFYYERKKNYYKNQKKPKSKVISIAYLSQAVMSIILRKPNYARARPSTLLNKDEDYRRVFNQNYPVEVYYACLLLLKRCESFLRKEEYHLSSKDINNYKFHLAMMSSIALTKKEHPTVEDMRLLNENSLNEDTLSNCFNILKEKYTIHGGDDAAAKGPGLVTDLLQIQLY